MKIGDLEVLGYFANGDNWCGEHKLDNGQYWFTAYDSKNRAYETLEIPERIAIKLDIALGFVGEYVANF
mgnify:CR=1 FL=1